MEGEVVDVMVLEGLLVRVEGGGRMESVFEGFE